MQCLRRRLAPAPSQAARLYARNSLVIVMALVAGALASSLPIAVANAQGNNATSSKVDAKLAAAIAAGGTQRVIVVLTEQADLSGAAQLQTKAEKTRYVYEALREVAARTQPAVAGMMAQMGLTITHSLYITNALAVQAGSGKVINGAMVDSLAARPEIGRIRIDESIRLDPIERQTASTAGAIPIGWNVSWVHAPQVWAAGHRGEGITVGSVDSGVQWDHPALINQYRGWNGSTADHNHNWWDADTSEPTSNVPLDENGHGTFTTGVAVGGDDQGQPIGVAPGAKWIACRWLNMFGIGSSSGALQCLQFMLAPWDLNEQNADPSKAADVVNSSFNCPACGLQPAYDNLRTAGIFPVVAAGNSGPGCASVAEPASFPSVVSVGALGFQSNQLAPFSSRGPFQTTSKPELVAPGVNIISAIPTNSYAGPIAGTSFAAPIVTGTVALVWSAKPRLNGDVTDTAILLESTAEPQLSLLCGSAFRPNNLYGYGTVDAAAAALSRAR